MHRGAGYPRANLFAVEQFGKVPEQIAKYLLCNREKGLAAIAKDTGLPKSDVLKGLSVLIHYSLVKFVYIRGFKYFLDVEEVHGNTCNPLYLEYVDRKYGEAGAYVVLELMVRRSLSLGELPEALVEAARSLAAAGVLEELEGQREHKRLKQFGKRASEDGAGGPGAPLEGSKKFLLNRRVLDARIMEEAVEEEIERRYNRQTRSVFAAARSFHPLPATAKGIAQRVSETHCSTNDFGFTEDLGQVAGASSLETAVHAHIEYLLADGALLESPGKYHANLELLKERAKRSAISDYIVDVAGEESSRIFNMLLEKKVVEDHAVQRHVLMENSAIKAALVGMYREGLVDTQMIPKSSECVANKSFYFWRADQQLVEDNLRRRVFGKINDAYAKLRALEKSKAEEALLKAEGIYLKLPKLHRLYAILRN